MAIRHKFENKPINAPNVTWPDNYATTNAILTKTPYKPEVIIIGTFNHGWQWNDADFFYGRGMYMWTVMSNLFVYDGNILTDRRNPLPGNNVPSLNQIFEICEKGKLCFADLILGTSHNIPIQIDVHNNKILVNGLYSWCDYKDSHLNYMGTQGWLDSNVINIINFIKDTPSIKCIYFTFATGGAWILGLKNAIINAYPNIEAGSIYTPTGMSLANFHGYPNRPYSLAHHWVWNNAGHATVPINNPNYTHLNHEWLRQNGVNPNNF
jgi:hypothetical protein